MAELVVVAGPEKGKTYEIGEITTLGRSDDCNVPIADESISRHHARVFQRGDQFLLEDLNSTNGTYLNATRIQAGSPAELAEDDRIHIGKAIFAFKLKGLPGKTIPSGDFVNVLAAQPGVDTTTILSSIDASSYSLALEPAAPVSAGEFKKIQRRLEILKEISLAVTETLSVPEVLDRILGSLFQVFPQAERGFVMLREGDSEKLVPKAIKYRDTTAEGKITVSSTIINEAIMHRRSVLSANALEDDRFRQRVSVADFNIHSVMCVPIIYKDRIFGIIHIDTTQRNAHFSRDDLSLLTGIGTQAALAIANANMHEALIKRQRLEQDLQFARNIQQQFLPRAVPKIPRYRFAAHYTPAFEIGGDLYDFIPMGDNVLGIVVADISGKGVSAALLMARLTSEIRFLASKYSEPTKVVGELNRLICRELSEHGFATMVFLCLDWATHRVSVVNAGHLPPLLQREGKGPARRIEGNVEVPLGVDEDVQFQEETFELSPGENLLLYTDGLVEAMDQSRQQYTIQRVEAFLGKAPTEPEALVNSVVQDVRSFVKDAPQSDDLTIVCFGRMPGTEP